jgi:hypothetical protein
MMKETGYDELINKLISLKDLPKGIYDLDVWSEGKTFNSINTETGVVEYSQMVNLSCGCCHDYEPKEDKFKSLYDSDQFEILENMIEKYVK